MTYYDEIGGEETFRRIVARFYEGVATDPVLRPLYPEEDLGPAEERFRLFLIQYWGGPTTYSDTRGHPRLRMRHAPFAVTPQRRAALAGALPRRARRGGLTPEQDAQFWDYVTHAAQFMVNTFEEPEVLPPACDTGSPRWPTRAGLGSQQRGPVLLGRLRRAPGLRVDEHDGDPALAEEGLAVADLRLERERARADLVDPGPAVVGLGPEQDRRR